MFHQRPDEEERVAQLAVRLYQQDLERRLNEQAAQSALKDLQVPPEYLDKARLAYAQSQLAQGAMRKVRAAALAGIAVLAVTLLFALTDRGWNPLSRPHPFVLPSDVSQWNLDANESTVSNLEATSANGVPGIRLKVDSFRPSTSVEWKGHYWASAQVMDGPYDLRGLNTMTFQARANGLRRIRFRFLGTYKEWDSRPMDLTGDWKTYTIDLNRLGDFDLSWTNGMPTFHGVSHPSETLNAIQFQSGEYLNAIDARGTVDVAAVEFH